MFLPSNSQETSSVNNEIFFNDIAIIKEEIEDDSELNNPVEVSSKVNLTPILIYCLLFILLIVFL